jgi:hypothetical protein
MSTMSIMKVVCALTMAAATGLSSPAKASDFVFQGTFGPELAGATGSGTLSMDYDAEGHTLLINATWAGLSGTTTNAHIHCCTASQNTGTAGVALAQDGVMLPNFPLGVMAGSYNELIDLTETNQYSATFLSGSGGTAAGAEARLISNLASGNAYFNIHTNTFPGGEIRAFVAPIPEPTTYALMLVGLGLVGWTARRRHHS